MDIKVNTFDDHADALSRSAHLLDQMSEQITTKSIEIDEKIATLLKKVNLKLEDATQFLTLQKTILANELEYMKNIKTIISTSIKTQLLTLAENVTMFLMSVQSIYKEIPNVETKHALVSQKKDNISKIIGDINTNLNCVRNILMEFDEFNRTFSEDIRKGNFHCLTVSSDMRTVYTHIHLEYSKYVNDMENRMLYYNTFASNILEQIPNMRICNYYLPPEMVVSVSAVAQEIASDLQRHRSSVSSVFDGEPSTRSNLSSRSSSSNESSASPSPLNASISNSNASTLLKMKYESRSIGSV